MWKIHMMENDDYKVLNWKTPGDKYWIEKPQTMMAYKGLGLKSSHPFMTDLVFNWEDG